MKYLPYCWVAVFACVSCSPLKTSPHDEKHQLELTLHEVQTNLDDLRHDINCFQAEMQILDGRIKYYEHALTSLKKQDIEKNQEKVDQLIHQIHQLEKKIHSYEQCQQNELKDLLKLTSHANETTLALTQFKNRLQDLEQNISLLTKLKISLEAIAKTAKQESRFFKTHLVSSGETLEKIAKMHNTSVKELKAFNQLHQDLIVIGQELKIPTE
jgi:LysM repeat protein